MQGFRKQKIVRSKLIKSILQNVSNTTQLLRNKTQSVLVT